MKFVPRPGLLGSRTQPASRVKHRPLLPELERYLECDHRDPLERLERALAELESGIRLAGRDVDLLVRTGTTRGVLCLV